MPTVNNRGRLFLGSAFGCEPRRGRCNIRCRHGHLPPLAGFTGYGKNVCVLGVVVTSEHSADVIPPSGMRDSLWSRVVVTPAAMVRPVSRVLGHRGARRLTAASHVPLMFSL